MRISINNVKSFKTQAICLLTGAFLFSGCAGLRLYNSSTDELAQKAETHFKNAKISKSLGDART